MIDGPNSITLADLKNFDAQLTREFEDWFPKLDDKIFASGASGVCVDPFGFLDPVRPGERERVTRWGLYAEGFREAADRLVNGIQAHERNTTPGAGLIYPILFCYRHSLELQLKILFFTIEGLSPALPAIADKKTDKSRKQRQNLHGLKDLWEALQELPQFSDSWATDQERKAFLKLLLELDGHDCESQAARYPVDTKNRQTLLTLTRIDLNTLKIGVHKISRYLAETLEYFFQTVAAEINVSNAGADEDDFADE